MVSADNPFGEDVRREAGSGQTLEDSSTDMARDAWERLKEAEEANPAGEGRQVVKLQAGEPTGDFTGDQVEDAAAVLLQAQGLVTARHGEFLIVARTQEELDSEGRQSGRIQ